LGLGGESQEAPRIKKTPALAGVFLCFKYLAYL